VATNTLLSQGPLFYVLMVGGLALVLYAGIEVIRTPGLSTRGRWGWGLAIAFGFGLFWLPGVIVAAVFLVMKGRWRSAEQ